MFARFALSSVRAFATEAPPRGQTITKILTDNLTPGHLKVVDVSGGCGQMFQIEVASARFDGMSLVNQHRLVTELLASEIKEMHGLSIKTLTPAQLAKQTKPPGN